MTVITHTFTGWDVVLNFVVDVLSICFYTTGLLLDYNIVFTYNIMFDVILQTINVVYEQLRQ